MQCQQSLVQNSIAQPVFYYQLLGRDISIKTFIDTSPKDLVFNSAETTPEQFFRLHHSHYIQLRHRV